MTHRQAHIFYEGTVQGVGFRYTTQRFAESLGLKGWVRNCRDGRVEIVADGPQDKVDQLLQKLEDSFEGYIRGRDVQYEESHENHRGFQIRH